MTYSEAGKLGAESTKKVYEQHKKEEIEAYYQNPKFCPVCHKVISYERRNAIACCASHSVTITNQKRHCTNSQSLKNFYERTITLKDENGKVHHYDRNNISDKERQEIISILNGRKEIRITPKLYEAIHGISSNKSKVVRKCTVCGRYVNECRNHEVCLKISHLRKNLIKFGFNPKYYGTEKAYDEYLRVRSVIEHEYLVNRITEHELVTKYGYTSGSSNFCKLLRSLGIRTMNHSEAIHKSYELGRGIVYPSPNYQFKTEHHQSWTGDTYFLRSANEISYASILDERRVRYAVEDLRIEYYDSQNQKMRIAIPDFHLIDTNEIVEIKSSATLDVQNMKDRFEAYKKFGYKPHLILNFNEVDLYNIENEVSQKEYDKIMNRCLFSKDR